VISYRNTRQFNEDPSWEANAHQRLDLTAEMMLAVVDAETGQRGSVITGKEEFLEFCEAALVGIDGVIANLKDKTKNKTTNARASANFKR
jgi:CHASE3 domain sensor protein